MKEKIRVIIKKTDERYGHEEEIPNTLTAIQEAVGGFIEARNLGEGLLVSGGMIAAYCLARAIFGRKK